MLCIFPSALITELENIALNYLCRFCLFIIYTVMCVKCQVNTLCTRCMRLKSHCIQILVKIKAGIPNDKRIPALNTYRFKD